jgi:four helix bundle protein
MTMALAREVISLGMHDEEPLKVLEAARAYAMQVMEIARKLPRHAPSNLRSQLVESARSVGSNIAEGWGRGTTTEKIHYSRMANGSLEESQEHLRECVNTHFIDRKTFYKPWNVSVATGRMLASLISHLERKKLE